MIRVILAATDGSDHAKKAVALASEVAAKFKAKLVLLHVLLRDVRSDALRQTAKRSSLTKSQREMLDNYEAEGMVALAEAGAYEGGYVPIPPPTELLKAIGDQLLNTAEAAAKKAGVKSVSKNIVSGDAADAILGLAKHEKADMIVLGTRGFGELKGFFLGSVSHKVSAQAGCACVTVK